jgi:hypothetical protein
VTNETVILVHGHGAHPVLLEPLRRALERAGFRAVNWRYGSPRGSIETHAARLAAKATELDDDADVGRLHFVGHSREPSSCGAHWPWLDRESSVVSCCSRRRTAAPD